MLSRRCVTLRRRCFNVVQWRCINVVQSWKSDVGFCFIFNTGSTLFQRWSTTKKQRWSDTEILAGLLQVKLNTKWLAHFLKMLKKVYREEKITKTLSWRWFLKSRQISWWIYDGPCVKQIFRHIFGRLLLGLTIVRGAFRILSNIFIKLICKNS